MPNVELQVADFFGSLASRLQDCTARPSHGDVVLYWLGQAGFVIETSDYRILIDPYLSDSLARKYQGTRFDHVRMMAAPVVPEQLTHVDLVLCTHRHTDHMDPETLQPLAAAFPNLRLVVPAASIDEARRRCGVSIDRLVLANAGELLEPLPGLTVCPVASAHETLAVDDAGRHEWLGYVIDTGSVRLYHSGDCVPYPGLVETLASHRPDVALLPVNGRDLGRSGNGVPGNFTLDEAVTLCRDARVPVMIAHHYGLFSFNSLSPQAIDERVLSECRNGLELVRARLGREIRFRANYD